MQYSSLLSGSSLFVSYLNFFVAQANLLAHLEPLHDIVVCWSTLKIICHVAQDTVESRLSTMCENISRNYGRR